MLSVLGLMLLLGGNRVAHSQPPANFGGEQNGNIRKNFTTDCSTFYLGFTYQSITMSCYDPESSSRNEIEWFKERNGVFETPSKGYLLEQGQLLELILTTEADSGTYKCKHTFNGTVVLQKQMFLQIQDDKIFTSNQPTNYNGQNGDKLTLDCNMHHTIPYTHITWVRLPNASRVLERGYREFSSGIQELKLETLSKSDEGEYVCDVYDGRYRIASRWMKVTVGEHETFVEGQPTVIHVTTGQSVKLPCRVKPGINIIGFHWRWMPNSELFHDHASTENLDISTELFITSVTKEHEGQYWCTVDTNQGRAVRWINLIVSENPAFQSGQKFVYREWGRSGVRLTCLVNSDIRAVEIRWVQKHDNSDWVEYITTNPTLGRALYLRSPHEMFAGQYKCIVKTNETEYIRWMMVILDTSPN